MYLTEADHDTCLKKRIVVLLQDSINRNYASLHRIQLLLIADSRAAILSCLLLARFTRITTYKLALRTIHRIMLAKFFVLQPIGKVEVLEHT